MLAYLSILLPLKTDRRGVTALEYALIASVVAAVMVLGATTLGTSLSTDFIVVAGKV